MEDKIFEMKPTKLDPAGAGFRTILAPKESLTYKNCQELETMFKASLSQHKTEIILDCKSVAFMDSKALELLLRIHEELKNLGGRLKIIRLNPVCRDILSATRIGSVINVYEDIHQAVKGVS